MKQISDEKLAERIALLEHAEAETGQLSLHGEYELACLRELQERRSDAYRNSVRADAVEGFISDVVLRMRESGAGTYDYADIVEAQGQELVLSLRSGTHDTAVKAG